MVERIKALYRLYSVSKLYTDCTLYRVCIKALYMMSHTDYCMKSLAVRIVAYVMAHRDNSLEMIWQYVLKLFM